MSYRLTLMKRDVERLAPVRGEPRSLAALKRRLRKTLEADGRTVTLTEADVNAALCLIVRYARA